MPKFHENRKLTIRTPINQSDHDKGGQTKNAELFIINIVRWCREGVEAQLPIDSKQVIDFKGALKTVKTQETRFPHILHTQDLLRISFVFCRVDP